MEKLNTKVDKLGQILDVGEQAVLLRGPLVPVTPTRTGWPLNKFWENKTICMSIQYTYKRMSLEYEKA
jgi:hypothetical protein